MFFLDRASRLLHLRIVALVGRTLREESADKPHRNRRGVGRARHLHRGTLAQADERNGECVKKELKVITKELTRQGFDVRRTRRGHLLVERDGVVVGCLPGTASDHRALKNGIATLRRVGGFRYAH